MRLNVGSGRNTKEGWANLDWQAGPGIDVVADLEKCATTPIPLPDNSVDEFLLSHVIEHIRNVLPMMEELYRIAKPDAKMAIEVPHVGSDDAWDDPTHVKAYSVFSFGYFSQPYYHRADYGYRGDWQPEKISLLVNGSKYGQMTRDEILEHVWKYRNVVNVIQAELRAVKPVRPQVGKLIHNPPIDIVIVSNH